MCVCVYVSICVACIISRIIKYLPHIQCTLDISLFLIFFKYWLPSHTNAHLLQIKGLPGVVILVIILNKSTICQQYLFCVLSLLPLLLFFICVWNHWIICVTYVETLLQIRFLCACFILFLSNHWSKIAEISYSYFSDM